MEQFQSGKYHFFSVKALKKWLLVLSLPKPSNKCFLFFKFWPIFYIYSIQLEQHYECKGILSNKTAFTQYKDDFLRECRTLHYVFMRSNTYSCCLSFDNVSANLFFCNRFKANNCILASNSVNFELQNKIHTYIGIFFEITLYKVSLKFNLIRGHFYIT